MKYQRLKLDIILGEYRKFMPIIMTTIIEGIGIYSERARNYQLLTRIYYIQIKY